MNYAIILAGGVGQRMRSSGLPKQFLEVFQKPIIIYTLERFDNNKMIDGIVVSCNGQWIDYLNNLLKKWQIKKVIAVVSGGKTRQDSVKNGLSALEGNNVKNDDIIIVHDGVRPLIEINVIDENISVAKRYGSAMTVSPVIESVVVTKSDEARFEDFKKRDDTYSLTSPQSFQFGIINSLYKESSNMQSTIPILDSALAYTFLGNSIHIVRENSKNIKVTTPEDYYILKALLELKESRYIFGI